MHVMLGGDKTVKVCCWLRPAVSRCRQKGCDKNNSLSKASSEEYPKCQHPFLLDIVFLQSAFYCPFIVLKKKVEKEEKGKPTHKLNSPKHTAVRPSPPLSRSCPCLLLFHFYVGV